MVAVPSIRDVRAFLIWPLYVNEENATGDLAYVMADGSAYLERLRAASDLYHMHRVPLIYILNEQRPSGFNFVTGRLESTVDRAMAYLESFGVPSEAIRTLNAEEDALMGSLSEAAAVAKLLPDGAKVVVVVTSAPHTRRSRLCFQRSLPEHVKVMTYSASIPRNSAELQAPIFHEYIKLLVYYLVA